MSVALLLPLLGPIAAALTGVPAPARSPVADHPPASATHGSVLQKDRVYALSRLNGKAVPAEVEFAKRKDSAASTIYGRITGERVRIRHTLRDGTFRHAVDVELRLDPTIW